MWTPMGPASSGSVPHILAEPQWADVLGDADRRGLTPLFTSNMTPYGDIQLDTTRRLALGGGGAITGQAADPPGRRDR